MPKDKLKRFKEVNSFKNCYYMSYEQAVNNAFSLSGKWGSEVFNNANDLVLELGCGKGEFTVGLGEKHLSKNYIGVDIKGNRIWKGAKYAMENNVLNVAFLRTRIDFIDKAFAKDEVSEIWITFPDPQPRSKKEDKRLTSLKFLNNYKNILQKNGIVHLKTDSEMLYQYTLKVIEKNKFKLLLSTPDLYTETNEEFEEVKSIKTYYEQLFSSKGFKIAYIRFCLHHES